MFIKKYKKPLLLGDHFIRPNSEFKASTPLLENHPILAPQSAPPELAEQSKMNAETKTINNIIDDDKLVVTSNALDAGANTSTITAPRNSSPTPAVTSAMIPMASVPAPVAAPIEPEISFVKPVPGSTLRCLEDPSFDTDINSPSVSRNLMDTEVLDKARDRFDRFWGNNKDDEDANL